MFLKKILQFFSLIMMSLFITVGAICIWFYIFLQTPLTVSPPGKVIIIPQGSALSNTAKILEQEGILKHPLGFILWANLSNSKSKIKAGEYFIKPGTTPKTLMELFVSGKVIQHALTIVEGWTFNDLMKALNHESKLEHTLNNSTPAEIMEKLGAIGQHPEGQFFPETYCFPLGTTDLAFLKRAHELLNKKLDKVWKERTSELPLKTAYDVLILASIIEKESSVLDEYAEIAGVFVRRLLRDMPLQADPTVIYGVVQNDASAYKGELTTDLIKKPNPYNTYLNKGLPPTPIAMPSLRALQAATRPASGDSLYFVAKGRGQKGHVFSKTLNEHAGKVTEYRKAKQEQKLEQIDKSKDIEKIPLMQKEK